MKLYSTGVLAFMMSAFHMENKEIPESSVLQHKLSELDP